MWVNVWAVFFVFFLPPEGKRGHFLNWLIKKRKLKEGNKCTWWMSSAETSQVTKLAKTAFSHQNMYYSDQRFSLMSGRRGRDVVVVFPPADRAVFLWRVNPAAWASGSRSSSWRSDSSNMWTTCMTITSPWTSDRVWPAGSSLRIGESSSQYTGKSDKVVSFAWVKKAVILFSF